MKFTRQVQINLQRVSIITLSFVLINIFIAFFNNAMLESIFSLGPSSLYDFKAYLMINILIGLIIGILGGGALVLVNSRLFRKKSFAFALLSTAGAYILIFIVAVSLNSGISAYLQIGTEGTFYELMVKALSLMKNPGLFTYFILWGVITLFTLFLLQVNDKFGPGILVKFLMGKYHKPREEQRIFMFLDMRSSTTIAEKIGHKRYFNLLSDLFADITDTIVNHEGEIYQYIGDEIVISWTLNKGIKDVNCIHCYTAIQEVLDKLADKYNEEYNVIPEMKAGIHHGKVMAGEVGIIKKDIIYSGDVLNTASRIQDQCNQYNVDFLISDQTYSLMADQLDYKLIPLGGIDLRGKEQEIHLNTFDFD